MSRRHAEQECSLASRHTWRPPRFPKGSPDLITTPRPPRHLGCHCGVSPPGCGALCRRRPVSLPRLLGSLVRLSSSLTSLCASALGVLLQFSFLVINSFFSPKLSFLIVSHFLSMSDTLLQCHAGHVLRTHMSPSARVSGRPRCPQQGTRWAGAGVTEKAPFPSTWTFEAWEPGCRKMYPREFWGLHGKHRFKPQTGRFSDTGCRRDGVQPSTQIQSRGPERLSCFPSFCAWSCAGRQRRRGCSPVSPPPVLSPARPLTTRKPRYRTRRGLGAQRTSPEPGFAFFLLLFPSDGVTHCF